MISTSELAKELGISHRGVLKRIQALGLKPRRLGSAFALTPTQAKQVREAKSTPGPRKQEEQDA